MLSFLLATSVVAQLPGNPDPTFNAAAYGSFVGTVNVIERQPDGKILVGGTFAEFNGQPASNIARLNADGTVDTSFRPPEFYGVGGIFGDWSEITGIGIQSDGKIVVAGNYAGVVGGGDGRGPRRLNPDGTLDPTFNVITLSGTNHIRDLAIQPDDKIIVGGDSSPGPGLLVRLNADGTADQGFSNPGVGSVFSIAIQSDGKILVSGHSTVRRLHSDGGLDNSFANLDTNNGTVYDITIRPDGKLLIGGVFSTVSGFAVGRVALLHQNGTVDLTFNQGNAGANGTVLAIELLTDGKVLVAGHFSAYNSVERQRVARLNADGTLDNAFVNNPSLAGTQIDDLAVMNDGRVFLGEGSVSTATTAILLNSDGSTDVSREYVFSIGGRVRRMTILANGKILIAGDFNYVNGVRRRGLARLNPDGTLDSAFVPYFNSSTVARISLNSVVEQPDGKLLVGGIENFFLKRLNSDGSLDGTFSASFDAGSTIFDLALLPGGEIVVVGNLINAPFTRRVVRLQSNGQVDPTFNLAQPNADVYCVVRQPDGKLLIGGDFTGIGVANRARIARLNQDGGVDSSFDTSSGASGTVFAIALQSDGKVLVGGAFPSLSGSNSMVRIGRLNTDGSRDAGFAQTIDGNVIGLAIQGDGKILVGGGFDTVGGVSRSGMARLRTDGSLDTAFNTRTVHAVLDIKLQGGKILIAGEFGYVNGQPKMRIARVLGSTTPFDFDGDGKSDFAVFRPSENIWYELFSANSQVGQFTFGLVGDIPAPADFDGDGKTDEAIFRPSSGEFWYARSVDNAAGNVRWGQPGDLPRPSDFDGDGLADFILYRPSNGVWYRYGSTGQIAIAQFGIAGDQPLIGDFDGDGKADIAVFRPSTGDWWYAASGSGNQPRSIHWGVTGDIPAPADYDGDGKTDIAVFRPSNSVWYINRSSDQGYTIVGFGLDGDRPVPADYDGDGKADIAVFRPSNGVWYLMQSTAGIASVQWGVATDTALPNAFLP